MTQRPHHNGPKASPDVPKTSMALSLFKWPKGLSPCSTWPKGLKASPHAPHGQKASPRSPHGPKASPHAPHGQKASPHAPHGPKASPHAPLGPKRLHMAQRPLHLNPKAVPTCSPQPPTGGPLLALIPHPSLSANMLNLSFDQDVGSIAFCHLFDSSLHEVIYPQLLRWTFFFVNKTCTGRVIFPKSC